MNNHDMTWHAVRSIHQQIMKVNASQYPTVYQDLGIDPNNLGCIMLDTAPVVVSDIIKLEDLLEVDPIEHPHMQGIVSENVPHLTLLYGLMRPGPELQKHVDSVLDGWKMKEVVIDDIAIFETEKDSEPCVCIVALLVVTDELAEANARLRLLPHIDTYPEYKPHITLAYLKADSDWQAYVEPLSQRLRKAVTTKGLNYGD